MVQYFDCNVMALVRLSPLELNLLLMKCLPTMQNNKFWSKKPPRRNGFITPTSPWNLSYIGQNCSCSYFRHILSHFVSSSTTPIGRSPESPIPSLWEIPFSGLGHFIVADCPMFSSSQHQNSHGCDDRVCHHNRGYFDCLCRAVTYDAWWAS